MFVHAGNKKRFIRKKCVPLVALLVLFVLPAGAEQEQKQSVGFYTGWSFGLGDVFIDEAPGGHTFNHYMPNFILGVYFQHNFSGSLGLQLSINYQNCSNRWVFSYWERHEEGTESLGCFSFSLNGIAIADRSAMTEFYFLGGIGMFTGPFDYRKSFLQFSGGTGIKLRVRPGSQTSVNLAAIFQHFLYKYGGASNADYLRLQAGLEFPVMDNLDNRVE
jgi:hypothetical protein